MAEKDPLHIVGQTIADKYRIDALVGEGGFAVVYRATHNIWHKPVAIKLFNGLSSAPLTQRDELTQAFIQEGALLTELSTRSANIVQARDVGTYVTPDGQWMPFIVLEWLEGRALDDILESDRANGVPPWTLEQVTRLFAPVAAALDIVHGKGIAHRDIKPANLFVIGSDPHSADSTIKILDFGVAKMMSDNTHMKAALAKTGQNITSFTPQYGAPEQFSRSYGATGPWTDVFALALVAIEMLAGRPALEGLDVVQLAFSAGNPEKRPTPRSLGVNLPDAVEAVFRKALALRPEDRYESARAFWMALQAAASGAPVDTLITGPRTTVDTGATVLAAPAYVTPMNSGPPTEVSTTGGASTISTSQPQQGSKKLGLLLGGGFAALALVAVAFFALRGASGEPEQTKSLAAPPVASAAAPASVPVPRPECPERTATIAAGQFFMGSDQKDALANEKPSHNVKLDAYCIDLYEVTAGEYKACSDEGKCRRAANEVEWPGITAKQRETYAKVCTAGDPSRTDHPINCVTWEMANTYCKAQSKRLPTEAEWEYATRGPDGRVYPWGDDEPTPLHLNACGSECVKWGKQHGEPLEALYAEDDGYATTAPVGKFNKGRSRFGPFDVVGNVWEWVSDFSGDYDATDKTNPTGPATGQKRVIRGGAWNGSYATWLRPSFRFAQVPDAKSHGIGFRCSSSR